MNTRICLAFSLVLLMLGSATAAISDPVTVASPDGRLQAAIWLGEIDGAQGVPCYRVTRDGKNLVERSQLGLVLNESQHAGRVFQEALTIESVQKSTHDSTWHPVYGERSTVRDHFHQATIHFRHGAPQPLDWYVDVRAYDSGIAFQYRVLPQPGWQELLVARERSEFRLTGDLEAWAVYSAQGVYSRTRVSQLKRGCERPLVMRVPDGPYIAIAEARLVDFARMKLAPIGKGVHGVVSDLSSQASCSLPFRSPWRVIMIGDTPGSLLEQNDLLLNLNDPCALKDTSWIKPGKVIREVTLTTQGGKACVDFAVRNALQYVEFDAGWYGHEYENAADATTITVDTKRSPGPLDLHDVIRYAREREIGIILYVNRRALEKQLDDILPLYRKWGVRGVKYGFVNVGSQQWTTWLHAALRQAAENRLMVDVHDEYRPTGYSRTYPNLMTQEGIGGDETSPSNEQTLTILFTRMLAGAGDNTICYYNERVDKNASHAYQLAKAVCIYSPWQFLYWYDRPIGSPGAKGGAGGGKGIIGDEPELEFYRHVPTVWDDTRVLHGEIGQYAVIARRSGSAWYLGAMNDDTPRKLPVPLSFLPPGKQFTAHIYRDDPSVDTRTHVRIDRETVTHDSTFEVQLAPRSGQAIRFVPD